MFIMKKLVLLIACHITTLAAVLTINNVLTNQEFVHITIPIQFSIHALIVLLQVKSKVFEKILNSWGIKEYEV